MMRPQRGAGMQGLIVRFAVIFVALALTTAVVGGIDVETGSAVMDFFSLMAAALVLAILNAVVRPILILLTLPITFVTLGLSVLVLNGFLLWLTAAVVEGFHVRTFWAALFGTILLALISGLLNAIVRDRWERRSQRTRKPAPEGWERIDPDDPA
ncbi:MAG: phage holin family protein [Candidatus Eisenbacteria bacterium]|nr:phage holin family protein [Candidatus Eisenbacteria bacterium]